MKLSILIPTVPSRISTTCLKLVRSVISQIGNRNDIELLTLLDNHCSSSAIKRQNLLSIAQGRYVVFFDDDDRIANNYISLIMGILDKTSDVDCIVYDILCIRDGARPGILCWYDKNFDTLKRPLKYGWSGPPTHNMVYKTSNIINIPWGYKWRFDYDSIWAKKAALTIKNQIRINKTLYFYDSVSTKPKEYFCYLNKYGIS